MRQNTVESAIPAIWWLRHAHREMLEWRLIRVSLGVLAASMLIFTAFGPLGIEDRLSPFERLAFAAFCGILCWPVCHAMSAAILHLGRSLSPLRILFACLAGMLFMALPCTAVVLVAFDLFEVRGDIDFTLPEVYLNVAVAVLACRGVVHYLACQRAKAAFAARRGSSPVAPDGKTAAARSPAAPPRPLHDSRKALFERLPEMLGRDIVYVSVSGHYINVVTTEGSCLILMRLADAVAALGELGLQVHRSYWVAHRHITGAQRVDGRLLLRLTGGHELPVSRTHRVAVSAAVSKAKDRRA